MNATVEHVSQALVDFDHNLRHQPEWANWVDNQSYKYAIFNNGEIYPVKQIVSMATRLPKTEFSGGEQSNNFLVNLGFKIVSLRAASWSIKSGTVAMKTLDKSAFMQGTGIPVEIRSFFIGNDIQTGEHRPVTLLANGFEFSAYIAIESSPTKRTRLFWGKDFIKELGLRFPIHFQYAREDKELENLPLAEMTFHREYEFERYVVSFSEGGSHSKEWLDDELEETVKAYLWMLEHERAGIPYSKAEVNKKLREGMLSKRTKSSIEYRMQNISAVLESLCSPRIHGYLPAKNVGTNTIDKIKGLLAKLGAFDPDDYKPAADIEAVDNRVSNLLKKGINGFPVGQNKPAQATVTSTAFIRDPLVKAWVLFNAKGICEGCGYPAPFLKIDGEPFLEVHHVKALADGGTDTIENAVALCPNCHRRCHVSQDMMHYTADLYRKLDRLKR